MYLGMRNEESCNKAFVSILTVVATFAICICSRFSNNLAFDAARCSNHDSLVGANVCNTQVCVKSNVLAQRTGIQNCQQ